VCAVRRWAILRSFNPSQTLLHDPDLIFRVGFFSAFQLDYFGLCILNKAVITELLVDGIQKPFQIHKFFLQLLFLVAVVQRLFSNDIVFVLAGDDRQGAGYGFAGQVDRLCIDLAGEDGLKAAVGGFGISLDKKADGLFGFELSFNSGIAKGGDRFFQQGTLVEEVGFRGPQGGVGKDAEVVGVFLQQVIDLLRDKWHKGMQELD
jgi:hypothetical protein